MKQETQEYLQENGQLVTRSGKLVREVISTSTRVSTEEVELFNRKKKYEKSYDSYRREIVKQKSNVMKQFRNDRWNRKMQVLFIPFMENDVERLPCIESVHIQFVKELEYEMSITFRASDVNALEQDIKFIYDEVQKYEFDAKCKWVNIHYHNLHEYIDPKDSKFP